MERHQDGMSMIPDSQNIWSEVQRGLRAFIARRVADEAVVEDLLQEVFVRMQRGLGGLKRESRLVSWIYQIARHAIIDYYRAPGRRREIPAGLAADLEAYQSSSTMTTASEDSGQLRTELAGCLRPMIERLSVEYRQAVILVDLEGIAQQEAAVQLGLSLSGMKSRVQRGRRQLKGMLEDCCTIEFDRRRGVVDFDLRNQQDNSCRDRPGC